MSDVTKDAYKIWSRLFDHKAFVNGEIQFCLREFEQKRKNKEVDNLICLFENVTDVNDNQIDRVRSAADCILRKTNADLSRVINLCSQISDLQLKYGESTTLDISREDRKIEWEHFVDDTSNQYTKLDNLHKKKETELKAYYKTLTDKLKTLPN